MGDQERLDRPVGVEERLHVDDQVLQQRQALDRLDRDLVALVADQVLDQDLAAQPVPAVDPHGVGPADAVRAGPAEGQGAVDVPLDVVQDVQQPVAGLRRDPATADSSRSGRVTWSAPARKGRPAAAVGEPDQFYPVDPQG